MRKPRKKPQKTAFDDFQEIIFEKGCVAALEKLKTQKSILSELKFNELIREVSLFLKNNREVVHTPTWYGEYISYSESYSNLKNWVEEIFDQLQEASSSERSWFSMATDILFSPLALASAFTFFLIPVANAAGRVRFEGRPGEGDAFQIREGQTTEIQDFEPSWNTQFGKQVGGDLLDIRSWRGRQPGFFFYQVGNDTKITLGYEEVTEILLKNFKAENLCLSSPEDFGAMFSVSEKWQRSRIKRECATIEVRLTNFENSPFINLEKYQAIPFSSDNADWSMGHARLTHKDTGFSFAMKMHVGWQFISRTFSRLLSVELLPVIFFSRDRGFISFTLPQESSHIVLDVPEKDLWLRGVNFHRSLGEESLLVLHGSERILIRGADLLRFCVFSKSPFKMLLNSDEIVPLFLDCSELSWKVPEEQNPDSENCKVFSKRVPGSDHEVILTCDNAEIEFNTRKASVYLRGSKKVVLSPKENVEEASIFGFVPEGEGCTRLNVLASKIKVLSDEQNAVLEFLGKSYRKKRLKFIKTPVDLFCNPEIQSRIFKAEGSSSLKIDCSHFPDFWGTLKKADVFRIKSKNTRITNWESEWNPRTGKQTVFDQIDLSEFVTADDDLRLSNFREVGKDTVLQIDLSGDNFLKITFVNISKIHFCVSDSKKWITPSTKITHYCVVHLSLERFPNTPFIDLRGYEGLPLDQAKYSSNYGGHICFDHPNFTIRVPGVHREEFFSIPMSNYLKDHPVMVHHVSDEKKEIEVITKYTEDETKDIELKLPVYNSSVSKSPILILFNMYEPNLLMRAIQYEKDKFVVQAGKHRVTFTGNNLLWLCSQNPTLALARVRKDFYPAHIDCSALPQVNTSLAQFDASSQILKLQEFRKKYRDNLSILSLARTDRICDEAREGAFYFSPPIIFRTTAPWISLTISSLSPDWTRSPFLIHPPKPSELLFRDMGNAVVIEGCPAMIRDWLFGNPFYAISKLPTELSLDFQLPQRLEWARVPMPFKVYFEACKKSPVPPTFFQKIWQNELFQAFFQAFLSLSILGGGTYFSIKAFHFFIHEKFHKKLTELDIPPEYHSALSSQFLNRHFYTFRGNTLLMARAGISMSWRDVLIIAENEIVERIKLLKLPKIKSRSKDFSINALPEGLLGLILNWASTETLVACESVNTKWRKLATKERYERAFAQAFPWDYLFLKWAKVSFDAKTQLQITYRSAYGHLTFKQKRLFGYCKSAHFLGILELCLVLDWKDLLATDNYDYNPLYYAFRLISRKALAKKVLETLYEEVVVPALLESKDIPLLYFAVACSLESVASELLRKKYDPNISSFCEESPLFVACQNGQLEMVCQLIEAGADVNKANKNGYTPLCMASHGGHVELVSRLLQAGADANQATKKGYTPLFLASQNGHGQVAKILCSSGADVNKAENTGMSPLFIASQAGHSKVVAQLVQANADVNQAKNDGETPLFAATQRAYSEIVDCLLEAGSDVNHATNKGNTPLHYASTCGRDQVIVQLLLAGAFVNQAANNGATALYYASKKGYVKVVAELLLAGANVNLAGNNGSLSLYAACKGGYVAVAALLLKAGADISSIPKLGTPFDIANRNCHAPVVKLLIPYVLRRFRMQLRNNSVPTRKARLFSFFGAKTTADVCDAAALALLGCSQNDFKENEVIPYYWAIQSHPELKLVYESLKRYPEIFGKKDQPKLFVKIFFEARQIADTEKMLHIQKESGEWVLADGVIEAYLAYAIVHVEELKLEGRQTPFESALMSLKALDPGLINSKMQLAQYIEAGWIPQEIQEKLMQVGLLKAAEPTSSDDKGKEEADSDSSVFRLSSNF